MEKDDARNDGTNGIYVADIGGGKYDHHQKEAAVREDGAKYAACGLLYNEWKNELFNKSSSRNLPTTSGEECAFYPV